MSSNHVDVQISLIYEFVFTLVTLKIINGNQDIFLNSLKFSNKNSFIFWTLQLEDLEFLAIDVFFLGVSLLSSDFSMLVCTSLSLSIA